MFRDFGKNLDRVTSRAKELENLFREALSVSKYGTDNIEKRTTRKVNRFCSVFFSAMKNVYSNTQDSEMSLSETMEEVTNSINSTNERIQDAQKHLRYVLSDISNIFHRFPFEREKNAYFFYHYTGKM